MSFSLIAHTTARNTSTSGDCTSGAIDTTGASWIVIGAGANSSDGSQGGSDADIGTISDSKGNSYTPLSRQSFFQNERLFYCLNPIVGSGHTFTSTAGAGQVLAIAAFGDVATFDKSNGDATRSNSGTAGSQSPTAASSMFVAVCAGRTGFSQPTAIDSSFTITDIVNISGSSTSVALAYKLSSSAENPAWSVDGNGDHGMTTAIFSPSSAVTVNENIALSSTPAIALAVAAAAAGAVSLAGTPAVALSPSAAAGGSVALALTPAIAAVDALRADEDIALDATPDLALANVITARGSIALAGTPATSSAGGFTVSSDIALASNPGIAFESALLERPRVFRPANISGNPSPFRPGGNAGSDPGIFRPGS